MKLGRRVGWKIPLLATLMIYGLATVLFTAGHLGETFDEPIFRQAGDISWTDHRFYLSEDHPPFAKWFGAIGPYVTGHRDLFSYRLPHGVLYAFGGVVIVALLAAHGFSVAGWIFALLYYLDPNIKAMAALDTTDFAAAFFVAVSATGLWVLLRRSLVPGSRRLAVFAVFFLAGLGTMSKLTAWANFGFLSLFLTGTVVSRAHGHERRQALLAYALCAFSALSLAILIAFHFQLSELKYIPWEFRFQHEYNAKGHETFLLGELRTAGFWYFYLVLFLFKLPLPTLALFGLALFHALARPRERRSEILYFFLPALVIFGALSLARVQLGFRYVLPGLVMLYLGTAVILDAFYGELTAGGRKALAGFWVLAGLALALIDYQTVSRGAYLAYFNPLAPEPTRNFADSNNDWRQGIPTHLLGRYPPLTPIENADFFGFFTSRMPDPYLVSVGATSLAGMGSREGYLLKAYSPKWTVAGYEIHELSRERAFELLRNLAGLGGESHCPLAVTETEIPAGRAGFLLLEGRSVVPPSVELDGQKLSLHPFPEAGENSLPRRWQAWIAPRAQAREIRITPRVRAAFVYSECGGSE